MVGTFPKSRFPDASQGPSLEAGLSKEVNSFVHRWGWEWKVRVVAEATRGKGRACSFLPLTRAGEGRLGLGFGTQMALGFRISSIPLLQGQRRRARVHTGGVQSPVHSCLYSLWVPALRQALCQVPGVQW